MLRVKLLLYRCVFGDPPFRLRPQPQSFQFLLDVFEFWNGIECAATIDEGKKGFKGFGGFLAIVNDYIKGGAHSEVNIESRTKRDTTKHSKFNAYAQLDLVREAEY